MLLIQQDHVYGQCNAALYLTNMQMHSARSVEFAGLVDYARQYPEL